MRRLAVWFAALVMCVGLLQASAGAASEATVSSATALAVHVLNRADLPLHALRISSPPPGVPMPLWGGAPGGATDLFRLYHVPTAESTAYEFLKRHLPQGGRVSATGSFGGANGYDYGEGLSITMPVAGPNAYSAQLSLAIEVTGASMSLLRVDAQVVWVPTRTGVQEIHSSGTASLTGYTTSSLLTPAVGAVVVHLSSSKLAGLAKQANALPVAPDVLCMENSTVYSVTIRPQNSTRQTYVLKGLECMSSVSVSANGSAVVQLDDRSCHLFRIVVADLPAGRAPATRGALGDCLRSLALR